MAFCGKCGNKVEEGIKFCPSCGEPMAVSTPTPQPEPQPQAQTDEEKLAQATAVYDNIAKKLGDAADHTAEFDKADIESNKAMGILAYLGILVLVPLFAAKESKYARFHTNQGLVLCVAGIAYSVVYGILSSIILAISWRLYSLVSILGFLSIVFLVLCVMGILNVVNGRAKELPIIGKFRILK